MQPNNSQSIRENATPSSGTSPLASCKRVTPPPPGVLDEQVYYVYSAWFRFSLYCYSYCFLTSPRECFKFKNTKDNQVSNKMPFPLTLMLNSTIPVLSGHLAIPRRWPLNTGLTVLTWYQTWPVRDTLSRLICWGRYSSSIRYTILCREQTRLSRKVFTLA